MDSSDVRKSMFALTTSPAHSNRKHGSSTQGYANKDGSKEKTAQCRSIKGDREHEATQNQKMRQLPTTRHTFALPSPGQTHDTTFASVRRRSSAHDEMHSPTIMRMPLHLPKDLLPVPTPWTALAEQTKGIYSQVSCAGRKREVRHAQRIPFSRCRCRPTDIRDEDQSRDNEDADNDDCGHKSTWLRPGYDDNGHVVMGSTNPSTRRQEYKDVCA